MHNPNGKYSENALATAEIRPCMTLYSEADEAIDTVPIGVFHVTKIIAQNSDLRLECMDRMTYLNRLFEPQGVETSLYALGRRIAQTVRAEFKSTPQNLITSTGKRSILQQTVNGASWINMDDGTFCFQTAEGWMDVDTGETCVNGVNVTSDPELKENIAEVTNLNALSKISNMKFYSYDYKSDSALHVDIGTMAPDSPVEIQSNDGKAIDLYAYINLTTKAVQELSKKVEALEQKIVELEAENQALKQ